MDVYKDMKKVERLERDKQNSNAHHRSYLGKVMKEWKSEGKTKTVEGKEDSCPTGFLLLNHCSPNTQSSIVLYHFLLYFSVVISSKIKYLETVLGKLPVFPESWV